MDQEYKSALMRAFPKRFLEGFPDFCEYAGSKEEFKFFMSGTKAFRKELALDVYGYVLLSPGERREKTFSIELGWGFGKVIAPSNYLQQVRLLENHPVPSSLLAAGFWNLEKIEGKQAIWGEVIPEVSADVVEEPSVRKQAIYAIVDAYVVEVVERIKVQAGPFFEKVVAEGRRRSADYP